MLVEKKVWEKLPKAVVGAFCALSLTAGVALTTGATLAASTGVVHAKTLRFAFQGTLNALDPYSLDETFTLGMLGNVYEGLTKRDKELKIIPGLATSWEQTDPLHWVFHLRKDVKFQNGDPFTADDVIFSAQRVEMTGSDMRSSIPSDSVWTKKDDYTVEVTLKTPNPILTSQLDTWYIM
ncbi:MAG: ABC transporter substrate-binding protein, partial [Rhizobiaceae bacterium]